MGSKDITIPGTTPAAAAEALKKTGYNVKIQAEGDDTEADLSKPRGILSLGGNEFETLYKWIKVYGGENLLRQKNIPNGTLLVRSLVNGKITLEEIDSNTNHPEGYLFSGLPLVKQVEQHIDKLKQNPIEEGKKIKTTKKSNEGKTLLDVFPELNQQVPEEGGEPIKVKATTPKLKKITLDKEVKPKGNKQVKKENKITTKSNVMDSLVTKKDLMEMIRFGQPAPATKPGQSPSPTIAPAKPSRRDKPERKNPFKPKHNPKPKGQMVFDETQSIGEELPNWLKSDKLGIGKTEMAEGYESGYMSPEQFKTAKAKLSSDLNAGRISKEEYQTKYSDLNSKQLAGQKKATKDRKNNNTNESIVESIIRKTLNKKPYSNIKNLTEDLNITTPNNEAEITFNYAYDNPEVYYRGIKDGIPVELYGKLNKTTSYVDGNDYAVEFIPENVDDYDEEIEQQIINRYWDEQLGSGKIKQHWKA